MSKFFSLSLSLSVAASQFFNSVKHRVDKRDNESSRTHNTIIEGDARMNMLKKILEEIKLEAGLDGGRGCKNTSKSCTKEGAKIKEEQIEAGREKKAKGMFKAIEAHLLQNPDAYNRVVASNSLLIQSMRLFTYKTEITSLIPPMKVVEALVEAHNLPPMVVLQVIKRTKVLEETTYSEGSWYKTLKQMVEAPDRDNFIYSYSIAVGDTLANTFEKLSHEVKIIALPEGGSVWKNTSKYFADGEVEVTEEKIMAVKEKASAMFRAVMAYVEANPEG
ncbi:hypothetical protein BT93_A0275 [Corymbia citriodora subsp. variegata]|nr:hypothetical protein BT93_A0275 [Corymbia citriodora subsp. variegata]